MKYPNNSNKSHGVYTEGSEESEMESICTQCHSKHNLHSLAREWDVDIQDVHRITLILRHQHQRRVNDLRRKVLNNTYDPHGKEIAETLLLEED